MGRPGEDRCAPGVRMRRTCGEDPGRMSCAGFREAFLFKTGHCSKAGPGQRGLGQGVKARQTAHDLPVAGLQRGARPRMQLSAFFSVVTMLPPAAVSNWIVANRRAPAAWYYCNLCGGASCCSLQPVSMESLWMRACSDTAVVFASFFFFCAAGQRRECARIMRRTDMG